MGWNEDQQALAWQQIIKNRAFYNVRVRRSESWVDAACRTLDELIDQKEQAEKSLSDHLTAGAGMNVAADPPALVVRESQIDNVEVTSIDDGRFWLGNDALVNACAYPTAEEVRESVEDLLASAAEAEAVARAIDNGVNSEDKRVEALAEIIGDFAIADEHSGERNDKQLARLLISRGVTVDEQQA